MSGIAGGVGGDLPTNGRQPLWSVKCFYSGVQLGCQRDLKLTKHSAQQSKCSNKNIVQLMENGRMGLYHILHPIVNEQMENRPQIKYDPSFIGLI